MAVFSLIVLLILLAAATLLSLRPWEEELTPQVSVAPGVGVAVGDSVVAAEPSQGVLLADAVVAGGGGAVAVSAGPVAGVGQASVAIGIAQAQRVDVSGPGDIAPVVTEPAPPAEESPPAAEPVSLPAPAGPAPQPEAVPVVDVKTGAGPRGIGTARAPVVGGAIGAASFEVREGYEYALRFSFLVEPGVYGEPGSQNPIVRLLGDAGPDPGLGLQMRDFAGDNLVEAGRGLWSRGAAMGLDRFLSPVVEGEWHDAIFRFRVSDGEDGFYEVYLDGLSVDAGYGLATIAPADTSAYVDLGLFREEEGDEVPAVRFDAVELGIVLESMLP